MMLKRLLNSVLLIASVFVLSACGPTEPVTDGTPPDFRRLTEGQYRNIVADVFGTSIMVSGRFDTPVRKDGLLAVGARNATVTAAALSQYETMASSIADQVMSEPNRRFFLPCTIEDWSAFDRACASQIIEETGRLLFRRPLEQDELTSRVALIEETTQKLGSFNEGLATGLASLLVSPQFLFVADVIEQDPESAESMRLDSYSIASRLSFLLWDTAPDDALLTAAETGGLHSRKGIEQQVDRMIASPRLAAGVRAFFNDMLEFSEFEFLEKDSVIYPSFVAGTILDAQEQTLRTITNHVINEDRDYRDLFTTRDTFMTRTLGLAYRLPVSAPAGAWEPYQFPTDDPRTGIQTQLSFLALNSHPGRSSPTLRGKAIRNMLLCQDVPDPPPDVDFSGFNDPGSPSKTARERLTAHNTNAACVGCHKITDPIGLAMEKFDGAGQFRTTENGALIDTSGDLDGVEYADSEGLGKALHSNPATTTCIVNRVYAYASGQRMGSNRVLTDYLEEQFASDGYRLVALLKRVATSAAFYAVREPDLSDQGTEVAALASNGPD